VFPEAKILVPLDGSPTSEKLLPYVKGLATLWKAELLLLRVVDPASSAAVAVSERDRKLNDATLEAERYLREKALDLGGGVRVETDCRRGPVSLQICQAARECDLIAFAPHGHTGATRWIFGSVAEEVIRDASCPVLLVRGETNVRFHHLLLPVDTSEASLEVCRGALAFVPADIRVTLLHCHGNQPLDERWCKTLEQLTEGKDRWQLICLPGKAPEAIKDWAQNSDCDLIAMATRGRRGWEHFWSGSVTEQVAREAPCPLLVFPPASLSCRKHALEGNRGLE